MNRRYLPLLSLPVLALAGCPKKSAPEAPPKPAAPAQISAADLKKFRPNEAGAIPVIMYHRIVAAEKINYLNRPPALFRKDLETMKAQGYWPVNAWDVIANKMDVPLGKSPIAITFDDALPSQFHLIVKDGQDKIDPDCAVGIMETFQKASGWPAKATFFVLPKFGKNTDPFGQAESVNSKFDYLIQKGYEIGNHTASHLNMRAMNAGAVQKELATALREIKKINKGAQMQTMALPFGKVPRDALATKDLMEGDSGGTKYRHKAVFLAAWRPIASPLTKSTIKTDGAAAFKLNELERITPGKDGKLEPGTLEYWLDWFKRNPSARYISDGDPKIAAIPKSEEGRIDPARLQKTGVKPQYYDLNASSGGAKGGGGLSVN